MTYEKVIDALKKIEKCMVDDCGNCTMFQESCLLKNNRGVNLVQSILQEIAPTKPQQIKWHELDQYLGKPVFDRTRREWFILRGYKAFDTKREIYPNDECPFEFDRFKLYPVEI